MTVHKFIDSVDIELTLSPQHATVLANWASVSRTLNEAMRLIDVLVDRGGDKYEDDARTCHEELYDLEPALNALHQAAREKLWQASREKAAS